MESELKENRPWAAAPQPDPVPQPGADVQSLVIDDIEARRQMGIAKYGTPLQAHNGRDAMKDAYQEVLDLACYLRQVIEERSRPEPPVSTRERRLAEALIREYDGHRGPPECLNCGHWDAEHELRHAGVCHSGDKSGPPCGCPKFVPNPLDADPPHIAEVRADLAPSAQPAESSARERRLASALTNACESIAIHGEQPPADWLEALDDYHRWRLASPEAPAKAALEQSAASDSPARFVDIVFDGPPGPEAGRFVEVEVETGASIRFGTWIKRHDGYWALRFTAVDALESLEVRR